MLVIAQLPGPGFCISGTHQAVSVVIEQAGLRPALFITHFSQQTVAVPFKPDFAGIRPGQAQRIALAVVQPCPTATQWVGDAGQPLVVVIVVVPLMAAAVGKGADQSAVVQIGKFHNPPCRRDFLQQVAHIVILIAGDMAERRFLPRHQVQIIEAVFMALPQPINHHHAVGQVLKIGRQVAIGTGGINAAPLMVIFIPCPGLVIVVPADQTVMAVIVVEQVISVRGIRLDQPSLFILPVFSQHRFLATVNALHLAQKLTLPHQQQFDAVTVPDLAQVAFGVAQKVDAVAVVVGNG